MAEGSDDSSGAPHLAALDDQRWVQEAIDARHKALDRVRATAEAWGETIGLILGVFMIAAFLKGPDGLNGIPAGGFKLSAFGWVYEPARTVVNLVLIGVITLALALVLAAVAAQEGPAWAEQLTGRQVAVRSMIGAKRSIGLLFASRLMTALAAVIILTGMAMAWTADVKGPAGADTQWAIVTASGQSVCGSLSTESSGEMVITPLGRSPLRVDAGSEITEIEVCPLAGSSPIATPVGPNRGSPSPSIPPSVAPTRTPSPGDASKSLSDLLGRLVVAPEQRTGYSRDLFRHWINAGGNGCRTRQAVLIEEAVVGPRVGPGCSLSAGSWVSMYDRRSFTDPGKLDIDHVVPLAEAWDSGADTWRPERRQRFANDLDVPWALIAVSASSNRSKGDRDPAEWLTPDLTFHCTYAAMWIGVTVRWTLSIDSVERDVLTELARACPNERVDLAPAP